MSIKIENIVTLNEEQLHSVIMGARNPMNSWDRSDTSGVDIGDADLDLLKRLRKAGTDHRKYLRMIPVWMDITAPLYWFKEADTYKVGTVANSCSTMLKIHSKEFTMDDFSCDKLKKCSDIMLDIISELNLLRESYINYDSYVEEMIGFGWEGELPSKKELWYSMIQLLPSSYNQKRTIFLNFEVLLNMYHARKNHKLDEWQEFCKTVEQIPLFKELCLED